MPDPDTVWREDFAPGSWERVPATTVSIHASDRLPPQEGWQPIVHHVTGCEGRGFMPCIKDETCHRNGGVFYGTDSMAFIRAVAEIQTLLEREAAAREEDRRRYGL